MKTIEEQIEELRLLVAALQKVVEKKETEINAQITNLYNQLTIIANDADRLKSTIKRIKDPISHDTYQN